MGREGSLSFHYFCIFPKGEFPPFTSAIVLRGFKAGFPITDETHLRI